MDFDFPAPYDHEVPRRIGEARRQRRQRGEHVEDGGTPVASQEVSERQREEDGDDQRGC